MTPSQLFAGKPTLQKLSLWKDDAVFEDPITIARGRKEYQPQWYGLPALFSEIEPLHHSVTSAGNPITLDLKTRYKVKGIGKEVTIASVVNIFYDKESGKIDKVQDKWDGKLPDSSIKNVSAMAESKGLETHQMLMYVAELKLTYKFCWLEA
ncbi:MAG: hypothetical protein M1838_006012 [Thelocarpon superellum]|nr:MAG: hypothetical protein M1838_006012 [Thelocarpon superellum]